MGSASNVGSKERAFLGQGGPWGPFIEWVEVDIATRGAHHVAQTIKDNSTVVPHFLTYFETPFLMEPQGLIKVSPGALGLKKKGANFLKNSIYWSRSVNYF